jgi:hypothetical protein
MKLAMHQRVLQEQQVDLALRIARTFGQGALTRTATLAAVEPTDAALRPTRDPSAVW